MGDNIGILSIWQLVGGEKMHIADRQDKKDESENNTESIFWLARLEVEGESDSLCFTLNWNFKWRKQMNTSHLMFFYSCVQYVSVLKKEKDSLYLKEENVRYHEKRKTLKKSFYMWFVCTVLFGKYWLTALSKGWLFKTE